MSKYAIGRDIGELQQRVKALEERLASLEAGRCACEDEADARQLSDEELKELEAGRKQPPTWCHYVVTGFFGPACPGIRINDDLCIRPCPSCPPLKRINLQTANGARMCTVQVIPAGAACVNCPPNGHKFVWV